MEVEIKEALELILELAEENRILPRQVGDSDELVAEAARQKEACDVVRDYIESQ